MNSSNRLQTGELTFSLQARVSVSFDSVSCYLAEPDCFHEIKIGNYSYQWSSVFLSNSDTNYSEFWPTPNPHLTEAFWLSFCLKPTNSCGPLLYLQCSPTRTGSFLSQVSAWLLHLHSGQDPKYFSTYLLWMSNSKMNNINLNIFPQNRCILCPIKRWKLSQYGGSCL